MLVSVAMIAVWFGVGVTALLVAALWRDPEVGLAHVQHQMKYLPNVMLGRYIAFFLMGIAFAVQGNLVALAIFIFGLGFMAFHDTHTYKSAGEPFARHLSAALAALVVFILVILALISNGAA